MESPKTYLLTGVTGYLGAHLTSQLLDAGHRVVGTLRSARNTPHIRAVIERQVGSAALERLEIREADLTDDVDAWAAKLDGVDGVFAVASPFPTVLPKRDDELVVPARTGTLNLLEASRRRGVRRVVLTSSTGAAVYGVRKRGTFDESDWTDVTNRADSTPYFRSKTIAERAACDELGQGPRLGAISTSTTTPPSWRPCCRASSSAPCSRRTSARAWRWCRRPWPESCRPSRSSASEVWTCAASPSCTASR